MGASIGTGSNVKRRTRGALTAEINVTPLVDVMLVLLIIFMVAAPMLVSGVQVDLPESSASPVAGQDEPLSITIDSKGTVYLMDTPITLAELAPKLRAVTREKMDTRIFVSGDQAIHYGAVIAVMDAISQAGFTKVALITAIADTSKRN
jgi:biopolymer transport protein TolR